MEHPQHTATTTARRFQVLSASATLLLGLAVLIGWQFDIGFLLRPIPGSVAMNPLTALCFVLMAVAVLFHSAAWAKAVCSIVMVICGAKFILWAVDSPVAIDQLLYSAKLDVDNYRGLNNRMAPNTALAFIISSGALLFRSPQLESGRSAELLAFLTLLMGLVSVVGFVYQVPEFNGALKQFPMAVHTAVGFVLLAAATLLTEPLGPFMNTALGKGSGGLISRRLLPLAFLLPITLGIVWIYGERQGFFSKELGLMLQVVVMIVLFCLVIWQVAANSDKHDEELMAHAQELEELNASLEDQVEDRTRKLEKRTQVLGEKLKELSDYEYALDQGAIVAITDQTGTILHVNDNFCSISGYSREELIGQDHRIINSGHHPKEFMRNLWRTIAHGEVWRGIIQNKRKNGEPYWVDTTIVPFLNQQGKPERYMAIRSDLTDLTDLKETSERLAASEARLLQTMDNMMEGIQIIDPEMKYIYVNDVVVRHGKLKREQLLGNTMTECYPEIAETEVYQHIKELMPKAEGETRFMKNKFVYPDGAAAWFQLGLQRVPEGVAVLSIDITDQVEYEEEIKQLNQSLEEKVNQRTAQLEATNKELESFSYSVSHDLRAPLRAVNGFSEMVEQQYAEKLDENGKRLLGIIKSNAITMGKLIDGLLEFSRTGRKEVKKSKVDMHAIVTELVRDLKSEYHDNGHSVELGDLPKVNCDPQLMRHVWANLLSNAFKYSSKKENPQVTVWGEDQTTQVVYHVKDNGAGFNMQYAGKLFGVFQRLHGISEFEGTGVGLALVNRIVMKHNGRVWAEAEEGQGATFHFSLPRKQPSDKPKKHHHEQKNS